MYCTRMATVFRANTDALPNQGPCDDSWVGLPAKVCFFSKRQLGSSEFRQVVQRGRGCSCPEIRTTCYSAMAHLSAEACSLERKEIAPALYFVACTTTRWCICPPKAYLLRETRAPPIATHPICRRAVGVPNSIVR